jgi:type IV secretion system protein VirB2
VHANSALSALYRLEQLIQEAVVTVPRRLVAEAIDLVVFISGRGSGRRLETILSVGGSTPPATIPWQPSRRMSLATSKRRHSDAFCLLPLRPPPGLLAAGALTILVAAQAQAAGSGMPWEEPLQKVLESVQGPVAKIIAVIIIITTGLTLAFGETAGGFRKLIQIIFGLSIAFAASSFFLSFFSFGGGALIS